MPIPTRLFRAAAVVTLFALPTLPLLPRRAESAAGAENPGERSPRWLGSGVHPAIAYPPARSASTRPVTLMLHGMCDRPENECSWISGAATERGFLLCPRANGECGNGGALWRGSLASKQALLSESLGELRAQFEGEVDVEHDATLIGFSQGAYLALGLLGEDPCPFTKLLLMGASVEPDAKTLERAGIRRVLLAAGDFDGARPAMQRAAARLSEQGTVARFMSLGPVGHQFAPDMESWMRRALAWLDDPESATGR
jgi:predicted esterase